MHNQKIFLFVAVVLAHPVVSFCARPYYSPDLDEDEFVDFVGFAMFVNNWLKSGNGLDGDFDNNGSVDTNDLAHFGSYWLEEVIYPPAAQDQNVILTQGHSINIMLKASDENDDTLDYFMINYPSQGPLIVDGNTATYSPFPAYDGNDSFTFLAYDGKYESNLATIAITVLPDSDGDGLSDVEENTLGTNPNNTDSDNDGMPDGWELGHTGLNLTIDDGGGDVDSDGLSNADEYLAGTNPNVQDSDGDGLWDGAEAGYGTDPNNPDTDGDLIKDGAEVNWSLEPNNPDTDDDGVTDGDEVGYNGNINDYVPWNSGRSWPYTQWDLDANNPDTDGDGRGDGWEVQYATYAKLDGRWPADGSENADQDSLTNAQEHTAGTDPANLDTDNDWLIDGWEYYGVDRWGQPAPQTDPTVADTDGDGLTDGEELGNYYDIPAIGTNPLVSDTDVDGMEDGWEFDYWDGYYHTYFDPRYDFPGVPEADFDSDNLTNLGECQNVIDPWDGDSDDDNLNDGYEVNTSGTDPKENDTDGDELSDGDEINVHSTDPLDFDSDGDLLPDGWEVENGLNPNSAAGNDGKDGDPDGDGATNFQELKYGTNPNNPADNPAALIQQGKQYLDVKLTVGDHSGSNSERYHLKVGSITHQAPTFGEVEVGVYPFEVGQKYEIRIIWVDSNLAEPDYDYTALVEPNDAVPEGIGFIIDDPAGILGVHNENEPPGPNNTFYAKGKTAYLTLVKVDQLQWQTYGDNITLDTCPKNGGKRIFPGKQSADESQSVARDRKKVTVKAIVAPAIAGQRVHFRWWDVDDPNASGPPIDDKDPAGPNTGPDNKGSGESLGAAWTVTDANGEATVTFRVSMQPGDNFKIAASLSRTQLAQMTQAMADSGNNLPDNIVLSEMLTTWRKLWIERDYMAPVATTGGEKNHVTGTAEFYDYNSVTNTTEVGLGKNLPYWFGDDNQLEGGRYVVDGNTYNVISSTGYDNPLKNDKVVVDSNCAAEPMDYVLYDDDDQNLLDSPYYCKLQDDPSSYDYKQAFREAYIEPNYLPTATYSDQVKFNLNLNTWEIDYGRGGWDDKQDVSSHNAFWACLVVSGYQGTYSADWDPDGYPDGPSDPFIDLGVTRITLWNRDTSCIFLEVIRDDPTAYEGQIVAHEIGHSGRDRDDHDADGLLSEPLGGSDTSFIPETLNYFRTDYKW